MMSTGYLMIYICIHLDAITEIKERHMRTPSVICFLGFGEAAEALCAGFSNIKRIAWDIKLDDPNESVACRERIEDSGVIVAQSLSEAVNDADWILSLVTADQASIACREAALHLKGGSLYFEMNSCSPGTKKANAKMVSNADAVPFDVAIMSPVNPSRLKTPLLVSGHNSDQVAEIWSSFGYQAKAFSDDIGGASSVKMTRSIMIKGLEALSAECLLTAKKLGIEEHIIESLNKSFAGFDWYKKGGYNLERMIQHGIRRAAEMREVVNTINEAGIPCNMTKSTVEWQQRIGDMHLNAETESFNDLATEVIKKLER